MVAEPGGTPHHLVLAYPGAQLAFLDCRMLRWAGCGGAVVGCLCKKGLR